MRFSPVFALIAFCLSLLAPAPAFADADLEANARGMTLNAMTGRTLVGVTRDGSSVFSVYLDPDATARFHLSNGTRATASWEQLDRAIVCFKGLSKEKPDDQVCKRAPELGRGMDWATITLSSQNGKTTYALENPDEARGSSQMVYSFAGDVEIEQDSFVPDVSKWAGYLVVGRTLKDKEAWFASFDTEGGVDFTFASGKRFKGSYTLTSDTVCMEFPENPDANGCRKPTIKDKKIRWTSTKDGGATSEVVFMKRLVIDGPQDAAILAAQDTGYFYPAPNRKLAVSFNDKAGSLTVWNLMTGENLGAIKSPRPVDVEFSLDSKRFAAVHPAGVEFFDLATGDFKGGIDRPKGSADFREVAFLSPTEILIGDANGGLQTFAIADGKPLKSRSFGPSPINNMAFNAAGQVLVGDKQGNLSVIGSDLVALPGLTAKSNAPALGMAMTADGKYALVMTKDSTLTLFNLQPGANPAQKSAKMPSERAWSVEVNKAGTQAVVTLDRDLGLFSLPDLTLTTRLKAGADTVQRAAFVGDTAALVLADNLGQLRIFAPDIAIAKAWKALKTDKSPAMAQLRLEYPRLKPINGTSNAGATLRDEMNKQYDSGECAVYTLMRYNIRLADRREDCERAVVLRKASADFDAAISALACDKAAGIMTNSAKDQPRVDACRQAVTLKEETRLYTAAKAAGDCAKVAGLQAKFNEPEAANDCEFAKVIAGSSARAMYLAAVKFDTGGDRPRATRLYTEIMTRFPEEDVAIDAANRLTALADLAKMEASQAEQAATQSAALKAAEERAAKAEEAAKAAAAEAERQRIAREEEARRADQARLDAANAAAAQAAAQPTTLSSCNRVYVGMEFKGGMFGIYQYRVQGMNPYTGSVTIRELTSGGTQEISCSQVP